MKRGKKGLICSGNFMLQWREFLTIQSYYQLLSTTINHTINIHLYINIHCSHSFHQFIISITYHFKNSFTLFISPYILEQSTPATILTF
uniref:Uncharacterized protein n=1 Tax=Siphoviridae sp. ctqSm5 TaxID=2827949 RepID=A0A8S5SP46_9CAUD|nr:MAG TPA: hypothetical protein [Siphoviridae sp. ctqSm5]